MRSKTALATASAVSSPAAILSRISRPVSSCSSTARPKKKEKRSHAEAAEGAEDAEKKRQEENARVKNKKRTSGRLKPESLTTEWAFSEGSTELA
jgi:hypothetical protein